MKLVASLFVPAVAVLASAPSFAAGDKSTSATTSGSTTMSKDSGATFDRLDTNKDGTLSTAEAQKDASVNSMWKQLDSDNDGKVSRTEFMAKQGTTGSTSASGATGSSSTASPKK
jgi:hypothetical protein